VLQRENRETQQAALVTVAMAGRERLPRGKVKRRCRPVPAEQEQWRRRTATTDWKEIHSERHSVCRPPPTMREGPLKKAPVTVLILMRMPGRREIEVRARQGPPLSGQSSGTLAERESKTP
jgi:hypothetical protein